MEIHEGREYHEAVCVFCKEQASWLVYKDVHDPNSDWVMVCEPHKYTAFS